MKFAPTQCSCKTVLSTLLVVNLWRGLSAFVGEGTDHGRYVNRQNYEEKSHRLEVAVKCTWIKFAFVAGEAAG